MTTTTPRPNIHRLPTFTERASHGEKMRVTKLGPVLEKAARAFGAHTIYVCKNKTGDLYPTTFAFHGRRGFIARRTMNTVQEA